LISGWPFVVWLRLSGVKIKLWLNLYILENTYIRRRHRLDKDGTTRGLPFLKILLIAYILRIQAFVNFLYFFRDSICEFD